MNQQKANQPPEQNPKLEAAAAEIRAIFKKYDIAGIALMHLPSHIKYTLHLNPSYSAVYVDNKGIFKTNLLILSEEARKKKISDTINMLANLRLYMGQLTFSITQGELQARKEWGINPKPPGTNGQLSKS